MVGRTEPSALNQQLHLTVSVILSGLRIQLLALPTDRLLIWMNLQANWELWHALQEEKKIGRAS